ncbi:hypothetical protein ECANGB1_683 [Enterospora canceri]|uniref:MHD domain-containing protein n=1 Tax=Enterospora canceri TaxID=1081671 RepID=A0A1Y1S8U5_9MICR|nr:hypothetical protein ECANGB1_683 [Enterospora canceri]
MIVLETKQINKMITEIFITSKGGQLLYGNVEKYSEMCEIDFNSMKTPTRLSTLAVNDCIMYILYHSMDNFMASKALLNIKEHLKNSGLEISRNSLNENYFKFITELYHPSLIRDHKKTYIRIKTDNIYIDVVEQYQTVIKNNQVLKNSLFGEILYKDNREIKVEFTVPNHVDVVKTDHAVQLLEANKHQLYYKNGSRTLASYFINNVNEPLITLSKTNNLYKFTATKPVKFKTIRIRIPVPETAYDSKTEARNGEHRLNTETSYVEWRFTNYLFTEELIRVEPIVLEIARDTRSILIDFVIENYADASANITRSELVFNQEAKIWVKYFTQASHYEIRM